MKNLFGSVFWIGFAIALFLGGMGMFVSTNPEPTPVVIGGFSVIALVLIIALGYNIATNNGRPRQ